MDLALNDLTSISALYVRLQPHALLYLYIIAIEQRDNTVSIIYIHIWIIGDNEWCALKLETKRCTVSEISINIQGYAYGSTDLLCENQTFGL